MAIADPSQNYIDANWGDPELEWTAELEAELPEELQDWSLFEVVDGELRPKAKTYLPSPVDQNSCAHWRNPRDMMRNLRPPA